MESFDLWNLPINTFCNISKEASVSTENLKRELKSKFSIIFSEGLGKCTLVKATFELKDDAQPIFKPKRQIPFAAEEIIVKEQDHFKKLEY